MNAGQQPQESVQDRYRVYLDHVSTCPDCTRNFPERCPQGTQLHRAWRTSRDTR